MSLDSLNRFEKVCRGCMSIDEDNCETLLKDEFKEIFMECTHLKIEEIDSLPKCICTKCFQNCMSWMEFKRQCEDTDHALRGLLETPLDEAYKMVEDISLALSSDNWVEGIEDVVNNLDFNELDNFGLENDTITTEMIIQKDTIVPQNVQNNIDKEKETSKILEHKCDECNQIVNSIQRLETHKRWHKGLTAGICELCWDKFETSRGLRLHREKHSTEKTFTCEHCGRSYKYANSLRLHRRSHQANQKYICDFCGKAFVRMYGLKSHMLTHTKDTPFGCKICDKRFKSQLMLENHNRRHQFMKKFRCEKCPKSFASSPELTVHQRVHTGLRPFACEQCDKTFTTKSHLTVHMRSHTGDKPYICDLCPLKFSHKSVLRDHRLTHTGEKPHSCELCGKSFRQRSTLRVHLKTHQRAEIETVECTNVQNSTNIPTNTNSCNLSEI